MKRESFELNCNNLLPASKSTSDADAPRINFYDIDLPELFRNMQWAYDKLIDPDEVAKYVQEDGTLHPSFFEPGNPGERWKAVFEEHNLSLSVKLIVMYLQGEGAINWQLVALAIPNPDVLSQEDQQTIRDAILERCQTLILAGRIDELFAAFEAVFPLWFESFEVLDEALPMALQSKYRRAVSQLLFLYNDSQIHIDHSLATGCIQATLLNKTTVQDPTVALELEKSIQQNIAALQRIVTLQSRIPERIPLKREVHHPRAKYLES